MKEQRGVWNACRNAAAPLAFFVCGTAFAAQSELPSDARIEASDVTRFLAMQEMLADAGTWRDSALVVFEHYYLPGSPGLRDFISARIGSAFDLLERMRRKPAYYGHLRRSLDGIEEVEPQLREAFQRLEEIYPEAVFADVYFLVGRMSSGGTTSADKILIGSEMYGRDSDAPTHELDDWQRMVVRGREILPAIVVHELIHVNQPPEPERGTLLAAALIEGSADFLSELLVGRNINEHVHEWANPREAELWLEFREEMHGDDWSAWLYNGNNAGDRPADLGYYMGYRIAKAYYDRAPDHRQAFGEILRMTDYEDFLERSGYADLMER